MTFWKWVCARKAHDNPRGDFIRDTRDLMKMGIDPETRLDRLRENQEGMKQCRKLRQECEAECRDLSTRE